MTKIKRTKYTCLVYGEGRKDKNFLITLIDLEKFRYHTKNWHFNYDNASGGSPKVILEQCRKSILEYSYDYILCFIDIDTLVKDFPRKWKDEKNKLDIYYSSYKIKIIWQFDKLEDEFKRVLGGESIGKKEINKLAKINVTEFINSSFWRRILGSIQERERVLDLLT